MKSVHFVIPVKMRRKLKLILFLSISWMFGMIYYFQSSNSTKVSEHEHVGRNFILDYNSFCRWNDLIVCACAATVCMYRVCLSNYNAFVEKKN